MESYHLLINSTLSWRATWWTESSRSTKRSRRSTLCRSAPRNAPLLGTWWLTGSSHVILTSTRSRWVLKNSWFTHTKPASALTSTRSTSGRSATTPIDSRTLEDHRISTSTTLKDARLSPMTEIGISALNSWIASTPTLLLSSFSVRWTTNSEFVLIEFRSKSFSVRRGLTYAAIIILKRKRRWLSLLWKTLRKFYQSMKVCKITSKS